MRKRDNNETKSTCIPDGPGSEKGCLPVKPRTTSLRVSLRTTSLKSSKNDISAGSLSKNDISAGSLSKNDISAGELSEGQAPKADTSPGKVAGIIAEYNPIHDGHIYHLEKTREMSKADFVVAVMSGYFTQRGAPAVLGKWERARAAVDAGVDLVLEMLSCTPSSAKYFAGAAWCSFDLSASTISVLAANAGIFLYFKAASIFV